MIRKLQSMDIPISLAQSEIYTGAYGTARVVSHRERIGSIKRLFCHRRLALLVAFLAFGGLALATGPAPAVHAGTTPHITAAGGDGVLSVSGYGFTPSGSVLIQARLYNPITKTWHLETKSSVTAIGPHYVCHPTPLGTVCVLIPGGEMNADFVSQPGTVRVVAHDLSAGL